MPWVQVRHQLVERPHPHQWALNVFKVAFGVFAVVLHAVVLLCAYLSWG